MKHNKFGFTLAEVVVAMAIVGIIAVISAPMVTTAVQKHQTGAVLGAAINQIITGNQHIIQIGNVNRNNISFTDVLALTELQDIGYEQPEQAEGTEEGEEVNAPTDSVLDDFTNVVRGYWSVTPENELIAVEGFNGEDASDDATAVAAATRYSFSKIPAGVAISGSSVLVDGSVNQDKVSAPIGFIIYIDTNGWNVRPNRVGKDIFSFRLLNNGKLVPNETAEYARGSEVTAGDYAKRIVEDDFKVEYY